jgi:1-deoxy-D-xylulose-5-phosphate reductoisomerase
LSFPQRVESGAAQLDFAALAALTFETADARRFPGLHLSWAARRGPEGSCTVLNAANEVAVAAFLDRRIAFDAIHALNADTIAAVSPGLGDTPSLDDLLALDERARAHARRCVQELAR